MSHDSLLVATIAAGITVAFIFGLIAVRIGLPPIVGYVLAGVVVGPFTPGYVADAGLAQQFASLGVSSARAVPGLFAEAILSIHRRESVSRIQARDGSAQYRTARFRCVIAVASPDGATLQAEGTCEGHITLAPQGAGGFGYDPVFEIVEYHRTFAELGSAAKNVLSHRARAMDAMKSLLERVEWR